LLLRPSLFRGDKVTTTQRIRVVYLLSVNNEAGVVNGAARVTVTVNAGEAIFVQKSQYVVSKNRWVVSGTVSVIAGQSLTIAYTGGTYRDASGSCVGNATGAVVGTAQVQAAGTWVFDQILTSDPHHPPCRREPRWC